MKLSNLFQLGEFLDQRFLAYEAEGYDELYVISHALTAKYNPVSELFMPVSCEIVEVNEELGTAPERINADPYGVGWMVRVRLTNKDETAGLMSAQKYDEFTKSE